MRVILAVAALLVVPTALGGAVPAPIVLPSPGFPPRATDVSGEGPRLVLLASRYRDPGVLPPEPRRPPAWTRKTLRGAEYERAIWQESTVFLVYGGRYLLGADARNASLRYTFDLEAFMRPPNGAWLEPVTWAREVDGVLYVSNSHLTYASATNGRNAYVTAIDLARKKLLWRSPALVANARTFVVAGNVIVAGYGFTREADYLYLLDRRTGKVVDRLAVPSAPERIALRGDRLHVRAYDRQLVVRIAR